MTHVPRGRQGTLGILTPAAGGAGEGAQPLRGGDGAAAAGAEQGALPVPQRRPAAGVGGRGWGCHGWTVHCPRQMVSVNSTIFGLWELSDF